MTSPAPRHPTLEKRKRCRKCTGEYYFADVREIKGEPTLLDYLCPLCGGLIARWRRDGRTGYVPAVDEGT